jgi:hypothetical protein
MIGLKTTIVDETKRVTAAADKAAFRNFGHAGASIGKDARSTIKTSSEPSEAGDPPHTRGRGRKNIRAAVRYAANADGVVVGPRASIVGDAAVPHEIGGTYKGQVFDERPFMEPALERAIPRFAAEWRGSVSG